MKQPMVSDLVTRILDAIRQPELHMREIPILIGLAILIVFTILVLIAIFFVHPSEKAMRHIDERQLRRSIRLHYVAGSIIGLLAMASIGASMVYSSQPEFCASCHEMRKAHADLAKSIHKDVGCLSCHQEPGISGVFIEKLELVEMVFSKSRVIGEVSEGPVTNEACLRCHSGIVSSVKLKRIVKMKHKEPLEAGFMCLDCHVSRNLFHVERRTLDPFGMSQCVDCHNQKRASAECSTCHVHVGEMPSSIVRDEYPVASLPDRISCGSCHSTKTCLSCHSLQIPHPEAWKAGGHSMEGFTSRRLCGECHSNSACQKCHSPSPHGESWVKEHGHAARPGSASCGSCHKVEAFCLICHSNTTDYGVKVKVKKASQTPR